MWGFLLRDTIKGTLLEMSNFVDIVFGNGRILLSVSFDYTTDDGMSVREMTIPIVDRILIQAGEQNLLLQLKKAP